MPDPPVPRSGVGTPAAAALEPKWLRRVCVYKKSTSRIRLGVLRRSRGWCAFRRHDSMAQLGPQKIHEERMLRPSRPTHQAKSWRPRKWQSFAGSAGRLRCPSGNHTPGGKGAEPESVRGAARPGGGMQTLCCGGTTRPLVVGKPGGGGRSCTLGTPRWCFRVATGTRGQSTTTTNCRNVC